MSTEPSTTTTDTARTVTVTVELTVEVDLDAWCVEYGLDSTEQALTESVQDLGEADYYLQQTKWQGLARVTALTVTASAGAVPAAASADEWEITDYQVAARAVLAASTSNDRIHVLTAPGAAVWPTAAALATLCAARRCEWVAHPEGHDLKVAGSEGNLFFFDVPRPGRGTPGRR
jgi:hypothetical protein